MAWEEWTAIMTGNNTVTCEECFKSFCLDDDKESKEWYYGHDCE